MLYQRLTKREDIYAGIDLWNSEHQNFQIIPRLVEQNIYSPFCGVNSIAWGGFSDGELKAFGLAKYLTRAIPHSACLDQGWISLLVIPEDIPDRQTVGRELIQLLEVDLKMHGVAKIRFGGDPQNFLPGLPEELAADYLPLLEVMGYVKLGIEHDMYANLDEYITPSRVMDMEEAIQARPVSKDEEEYLLTFLQDNFPGRWFYEADNIRQRPGGVEDYWLLWNHDKSVGFTRTNTSESPYMGPNVNWGNRWGERYCGLGPIGISKDFRGNGGGLYLMDKVIDSFKERDFNHMVIDWTGLVDYYARLGFKSVIRYITLYHNLSN